MRNNKFEVGDKVTWLKDDGGQGLLGKTTTIISIDSFKLMGPVECVDDQGKITKHGLGILQLGNPWCQPITSTALVPLPSKMPKIGDIWEYQLWNGQVTLTKEKVPCSASYCIGRPEHSAYSDNNPNCLPICGVALVEKGKLIKPVKDEQVELPKVNRWRRKLSYEELMAQLHKAEGTPQCIVCKIADATTKFNKCQECAIKTAPSKQIGLGKRQPVALYVPRDIDLDIPDA